MHVLLTRPLEDSIELIKKFKDKGFTVSHLPLIKIDKISHPKLNGSEYNNVVFTSSNAIRNLDIKHLDKKILCFCVGDATEKTAKQKGFHNTFSAGGNVRSLKELILQNLEKKTEKILYISGELVSYDLDKDLIKEGLNVQRLINYSVSHTKELNPDFLNELKKKIPDIIYIYSQNSAESFLNLIKKYKLHDYWMKTNLMCIGEKTSSVLNEIKWKKIFLFNPGEEEFLLYKI
ncbi:uroporphyrinogen-III synthase [Candidatus Pelagibacter communis]|uniref:uroporphyrinogen-III synthase n=1 Tax=Pelagibacter ubique TaxID=198252 RepID=UPI00094D8DCB|nr:uroporphyrinogen-III synthase [Candidatus Pelagibacter ubique]